MEAVDGFGLPLSLSNETDSSGNYVIQNVVPGRYKIFARTNDLSDANQGLHYTVQYYPNATNLTQAAWVTVTGNTPNINMTLMKGGVIQGTSVAADTGENLDTISFVACPVPQNNYEFYNSCFLAQTRYPGGYVIPALPGSYFIRSESSAIQLADGRMYAGQIYNHKPFQDDPGKADIVTVTQNLTTTVNFRFDPGGTIAGSLIGGSASITQAQPYLYTDANTSYQPTFFGYQNGVFDLGIQPAGDYKLKIDVYGFAGAWYGGGSSYADAATISVKAHKSVTGLTLTLTPCSAIQFTHVYVPMVAR